MWGFQREQRLSSLLALTLLLGVSLTIVHPAPLAQVIEPSPTTAPLPTLRLNEVLAAPFTGEQEWVELINLSDAPISLIGWTLDDIEGAGSPPLALDALTQIGPRALLGVATPDIFANLGSDAVRLVGPDGVEVDRFDYSAPARGSSFGRIPDGVGSWHADLQPTPGAPNDPSPTPSITATPAETATAEATAEPVPTETATATPTEGEPEGTPSPTSMPSPTPSLHVAVRLNELLPLPGSGESQGWIELYNIGDASYDLAGWVFRSASGAEGVVSAGAVIGPGAWLVLELPVDFVSIRK